jgi:hypothetical protein
MKRTDKHMDDEEFEAFEPEEVFDGEVPAEEETGGVVVPFNPGRDLAEVDMTAVYEEGKLNLAVLEQDGVPLSMGEIGQLTERIQSLNRSSPWWLGDALAYAAKHWGDDWFQLVDDSGHDPEEIGEISLIAAMFPPEKRFIPTANSPGLTWRQHSYFAKWYELEPRKAYASMKKAATQRWNNQKIREVARAATVLNVRGEQIDPAARTTTSLTFTVTVEKEDAATARTMLSEVQRSAEQVLVSAGVRVSSTSSKVSGAIEPELKGRRVAGKKATAGPMPKPAKKAPGRPRKQAATTG